MSNIKNREELLNDPSVLQQIQERAYFIAESSGFASERDHENWLSAQEEVLTKLTTNGKAVEGTKVAKAPTQKAAAPKVEAAPETPKATAKPKATTAKAATVKAPKAITQTEAPAAPAKAAPAKRATKKSA